MTTTKVTASGGFHNADNIRVMVKGEKLSIGQYKRLAAHFCGVKSCICGGASRADVAGIKRGVFVDMVLDASYRAHFQR